jgi:tetratricopeptide (TPR) repeat protein
MPDLALRSQLAHARERLAQGDAPSALAVGRRILEAFPRCVAAYGLLGQALLQMGRLEQAEDALLRAWGACPQDETIRAGLAGLAQQRGQGEAQSHSHAADDRAALARLWLRQGRAQQAIRELRALLLQQPTRYDLQVSLAEALWRAGAQEEAAHLSEEILAGHPHCLVALLILGRFALHGPRDAKARRWLRNAQALDPDNAMAQGLFGEHAPLPPRVARLPYREEELPPLDLPYARDEGDEE